MSVKRYFAEDMRHALRAVRDELGPEAVILSNERVAGGIEVLAMADYDEDAVVSLTHRRGPATKPTDSEAPRFSGDPEKEPSGRGQSAEITRSAGSPQTNDEIEETFARLLNQYKEPKPAPASTDAEIMQTMRSEIENLRALLQDQLQVAGKEHWRFKNPQEAAVAERFREAGVDEETARRLARPAASVISIDEGWQLAVNSLVEQMPVIGHDIARAGGVVAMLGPTGAGKTTTVAKLAIRYALEYGRENLALVTTDCYRVAAYDQLKTLGRIIDVPVRRVDPQNSLRKIVRSFRDKSLVLIDMAGFNQGDEERSGQLADLRDVEVPVTKLLVLPSTSQTRVLAASIRLFAHEKIDGCVLSKVDETHSLGQVISQVLANNLPVAYITTGQSIPNDIEVAQPQLLVNHLIDAKPDRPVPDRSRISQLLNSIPLSPSPAAVQAAQHASHFESAIHAKP